MPELDEVDTSTNDDADTSSDEDAETADNVQDAGEETDDQGEADDSDSQDDSDAESADEDEDSSDADDTDSGDADDTAEDEDEDDAIAEYVPPGQEEKTETAQVDEHFDIRKVPRDPETGLLDPEAVNKAINEWHDQRMQQVQDDNAKTEETRQALTREWDKVKDAYPHIWKNKRLIEEVRDKHLASFSEGSKYLGPMAAAKRVAKLYNLGVRSGAKQQKSRRTVENMSPRNKGGGSQSSQGGSEYSKLQKMANSSDPSEAKKGRIELLKYRRRARMAT